MSLSIKQLVISDSDLVEKAQRGSVEAFEELVRRYQMDIRAFLRRRIHNIAVADDLAQEVFLGAIKSIEKYNQTGSIRSWLFSIARFKMIDYLRSEKRRAKSADFEIALEDESVRRGKDSPDEDFEELVPTLKTCIDALRPNAKDLVNQFYFENVSAKVIAEDINQKASTVRMTLLRIRKALAKCIKQRLGVNFQL